MRIIGEGYSGAVRVSTARVNSTVPSKPKGAVDSFINPERLLDDLAELRAARDRVMLALSVLDRASTAAGTPIRSTSAREQFSYLDQRLRSVESDARQAWQGELAAAGGYKPPLRPILVKAGRGDAHFFETLLAKDGNHLDARECDELLAVLESAIVKAREAGIEEYAASLFANLDTNTLHRLVSDNAKFSYKYGDKLLGQHLGDVMAELRDLFLWRTT